MFSKTLSNIEKKALIITLSVISNNLITLTETTIFNKKLYKKIKLHNLSNNTSIQFSIDNYYKCDELLKNLILQVFDEYNFIPVIDDDNFDILHNFSLLCNGIIQLIKEEISCESYPYKYKTLLSKLQQYSDKYTLNLLSDHKMSNNEKTCIVIVRHLIDNIISGLIFRDGIELLDFINGTRIIKDILCLNAQLYDENTYFRYYQQSNKN